MDNAQFSPFSIDYLVTSAVAVPANKAMQRALMAAERDADPGAKKNGGQEEVTAQAQQHAIDHEPASNIILFLFLYTSLLFSLERAATKRYHVLDGIATMIARAYVIRRRCFAQTPLQYNSSQHHRPVGLVLLQ